MKHAILIYHAGRPDPRPMFNSQSAYAALMAPPSTERAIQAAPSPR